MRRPLHLSCAPRREQGGFALFIVLIMMIVIAFLVVAATQSYNTEMRIGSMKASACEDITKAVSGPCRRFSSVFQK